MNNFMPDRPGFYEQVTTDGNNENENDEIGPSTASIEKEHMFDKVVTPSDVGKLNRLVIPKQHAEKYFPLDSSTNEKGLLLNFQDMNGKPWRFRYSYWNSSQSYVMTKGWSRFVKDKKLDAGDIVSFQRGVCDKDRFFIDWRPRPDAPNLLSPSLPNHFSSFQYNNNRLNTWNPLFVNTPPRDYIPHYNHYGVNGNPCTPGSIFYLYRPGSDIGTGNGYIVADQTQEEVVQNEQMVHESVPVVQGKAAAKRLRLFGVNMDCPIQETDECNQMLSNSNNNNNTVPASNTSSSSSFPNSLQFMRPSYNEEDKGKGSVSLDLDI